ncbi:hypothetical protein BS630_15320 [Rhizobium laguerreae]|nr:hypothetical protein BS630_15320 [Rhizobium laguerreae]
MTFTPSMRRMSSPPDPGLTATDLRGHSRYRTVEQAAKSVVFLSPIDKDGSTGGSFFRRGDLRCDRKCQFRCHHQTASGAVSL